MGTGYGTSGHDIKVPAGLATITTSPTPDELPDHTPWGLNNRSQGTGLMAVPQPSSKGKAFSWRKGFYYLKYVIYVCISHIKPYLFHVGLCTVILHGRGR